MTDQGHGVGPQRRSRLLTAVAAVLTVLVVAAALAWVLLERDTSEPPASKTAAGSSGPQVADVATTRRKLAEGGIAVDVRTPQEYAAGHLQGAKNIDLSAKDFDQQIASLDPDADYVVYCASGRRAAEAIKAMKAAEYTGELINAGGYEDLDSAGLDTQTS